MFLWVPPIWVPNLIFQRLSLLCKTKNVKNIKIKPPLLTQPQDAVCLFIIFPNKKTLTDIKAQDNSQSTQKKMTQTPSMPNSDFDYVSIKMWCPTSNFDVVTYNPKLTLSLKTGCWLPAQNTWSPQVDIWISPLLRGVVEYFQYFHRSIDPHPLPYWKKTKF